MRKIGIILASLVAATGLLGGCHAPDVSPAYTATHDNVSPILVTPDPVFSALAGSHLPDIGWEYYRNDPAWRDPAISYEIAEIRHRESLRTINGRPREYTTTRSRSIHWLLP